MYILFHVSIYNLHIAVEQTDLMLEVAIKIVCFEKIEGMLTVKQNYLFF